MFQLSRKLSAALAAAMLIVLALAAAQPTRAAASGYIGSNIFTSCTSPQMPEFNSSITIDFTPISYEVNMYNLTRGGSFLSGVVGPLGIVPPITVPSVASVVPAGTQPGDILKLEFYVYESDNVSNNATFSVVFNCSTGKKVPWPPQDGACGTDGRINQNCAAPVVVYCDGETLKVYKLDLDNEGSLLFTYDLADVPSSGDADILLKQDGLVRLYWRHEDGLLKLLAPQSDGKTYYMLLDPATCESTREGAEWGLK